MVYHFLNAVSSRLMTLESFARLGSSIAELIRLIPFFVFYFQSNFRSTEPDDIFLSYFFFSKDSPFGESVKERSGRKRRMQRTSRNKGEIREEKLSSIRVRQKRKNSTTLPIFL